MTEDVKAKVLNPHVFYVIEQLVGLFAIRELRTHELALRNAFVESVAINARNLLHFFETPEDKAGQDDVLAEHFGFAARQIEIEIELRRRVNKEVAHLTYSRIKHYEPDKRSWHYVKFVPQILDRAEEFIDHLVISGQVCEPDKDPWIRLRGSAQSVSRLLMR